MHLRDHSDHDPLLVRSLDPPPVSGRTGWRASLETLARAAEEPLGCEEIESEKRCGRRDGTYQQNECLRLLKHS